jgi:hypothetical protein
MKKIVTNFLLELDSGIVKSLTKALLSQNIFICSSIGMLIKRIYVVMLELSVTVFTAINSNPNIDVTIDFLSWMPHDWCRTQK